MQNARRQGEVNIINMTMQADRRMKKYYKKVLLTLKKSVSKLIVNVFFFGINVPQEQRILLFGFYAIVMI